MIRYILSPYTKFIYDNDGNNIPIDPAGVFVDLLEPLECEGSCKLSKARFYFPTGEILVVKVLGFTVILNNKDGLFDGRFNGVK